MDAVVSTLVDQFHALHQRVRETVQDLDAAALNWAPAAETNSIAVLVVHLLGSEADVLRVVRGLPSDRDRAAEFRTSAASAQDLMQRLDAADALLAELAPGLTADGLEMVRERPPRPPQTGLYWLVNNYGHACEHLAHVQLTRQLWQARQDR